MHGFTGIWGLPATVSAWAIMRRWSRILRRSASTLDTSTVGFPSPSCWASTCRWWSLGKTLVSILSAENAENDSLLTRQAGSVPSFQSLLLILSTNNTQTCLTLTEYRILSLSRDDDQDHELKSEFTKEDPLPLLINYVDDRILKY